MLEPWRASARLAVTRMAGVIDAKFWFEEGAGHVTYDPEQTDSATFIEELADMTGFVAPVTESATHSEEESR